MVEVKICGVCRPEDAHEAAASGADWIGVILAPGRTRSRTLEQAAVIYDAAGVRRVGVFVDEDERTLVDAAATLHLDAVQLHGSESPAVVRRLRSGLDSDVWKAVRVRDADDVARAIDAYASIVDGVLLDGWSASGEGGTGARFDWRAVARVLNVPEGVRVIVAGGLDPRNVAEAVGVLDPTVVDVSSGVESQPGMKSAELLRSFVAAARSVRV